ncbi:MAG: carbamate kinase [Calditrichota bacterium]
MGRNGKRCAVVALGGNAISNPDARETVADQFRHTRESLRGIIDLLKSDYLLALTHGNGPQVGAALRRVELTRDKLPDVPLGLLVADTEGSMGYMIEQSLQNLLAKEGLERDVVTVVTQVLVDENDPALSHPTKFVGDIYTHVEAQRLSQTEGWILKPYRGINKWRRVVGSPAPLQIINHRHISELVRSGAIVIAAGGGGIPVYRHPDLGLEGVDAVIDKDLASAILARDIGAQELVIVTNIDCVRIDYGQPSERPVKRLTIQEAKILQAEGQFPAGNMGPKILAAIQFVESGGEKSIICSLEGVSDALKGKSGTTIIGSDNFSRR